MNRSFQSVKAAGQKAGPPRRAVSAVTVIAAIVWLSAIISVMAVLVDYSNSPVRSGAPPLFWPAQSAIPRDASRPTLVLFAHPRCPCTRASVGELELLMAHCPGRLSAHVMFIRPAGTGKDWVESDLWRKAAGIPGVIVHRDEGGGEARRFHSEISGHSVLYDGNGSLLFQGGITSSRGHSGDNPGRSAIEAFARNEKSHPVTTPVFGCALFETGCQGPDKECKQ